MTIWKFPLVIDGEQVVEMPIGAEILTVQMQHGFPFMWALVDPEAGRESRTIRIIGTGHHFGPPVESLALRYISTIQTDSGLLVWHVFEKS